MDIALLSMTLSQMDTDTQVGTAVTKLALDTGESQASQFVQDMAQALEQSVNPSVGTQIDMIV